MHTNRILLIAVTLNLLVSITSAQQSAEKAGPVFKDGQAQVVEAFNHPREWIRQDLWVETESDSDGNGKLDRMHVDVTRPVQTQTEGLKVPVIYNSSPYFSGVGASGDQYMWNPRQEVGASPVEHQHPPEIAHGSRRPIMSQAYVNEWVSRGFAVVHSASPGTGLSQGCPTVGGENESLAPKAVIDWMCGRAKGYTTPDGIEEVVADWCTGKVGMIGTSYNGTIPLAAATTGVEGLECIIPVAPNTSYYNYYRSYGLIRHPGGYMGEDIDVLYDFINSGDPAGRENCNSEIRDKLMAEGFDRKTGDYNAFWAGRDYLNKLDKVHAATLMSHGFNDWNVMPEHSFRIYQALKELGVPVQCYYHQNGHGGDPPMERVNRWFTRYLYGVENEVENDAKAWIVREGDKPSEPTPYSDYPNPEAKPVTLYLEGEGNKIGVLGEQPAHEATQTLTDDVNLSGKDLASIAESKNRLLFATPVLTKDVHISGLAKIKIKAASSKAATNLSVWLVSLPYTNSRRITDNIITRGWADLQNHKSLTESEPLVPGQFYEMEFNLQPDDQVIPAGQQIGLMIFASDRDFTLWPEPGTELTVDLGSTSLVLPIVGGVDALK